MRLSSPLLSVMYPIVLLLLSLTVSKYLSIPLALYGLWNPKTASGTLVILFILDCLFGVARTAFFGYPGVLFLSGAVCFGLFTFIRSRLASHVLS